MTEPEKKPFRDRPIPEVIDILTENLASSKKLGETIIALAINAPGIEDVRNYRSGMSTPNEDEEATLRDMAAMTETMLERGFTSGIIQGILFGSNQRFDGEAPITLISRGESARVAAAAKDFLTGYW